MRKKNITVLLLLAFLTTLFYIFNGCEQIYPENEVIKQQRQQIELLKMQNYEFEKSLNDQKVLIDSLGTLAVEYKIKYIQSDSLLNFHLTNISQFIDSAIVKHNGILSGYLEAMEKIK